MDGVIMKVISWNCNRTFREDIKCINEKASELYVDADIYVICECENPDKTHSDYKEYKKIIEDLFGDNYFWVGNLHYMGLGIFAKDDVDLKEIETNGNFEFFKAFRVNDSFNLLAIWVQNENEEKGLNPYVEMIHDFYDANLELFDENLIICGDLNSNVELNPGHKTKDSNGNAKNHTNLDNKLNNKGLFSVYHELTNEKNGEETQQTFFQARHINDCHHFDYVYANKKIIEKTTLTKNRKKLNKELPNEFEILDHWKWFSLSDHLPLVFEFDENQFK